MKIRDVEPGKEVEITRGPAKGRKVRVIAKGNGNRVAIHDGKDGQTVQGDLEVKEKGGWFW